MASGQAEMPRTSPELWSYRRVTGPAPRLLPYAPA